MLDLTLAASAALMGLAGTVHCAAMCGPAAAAVGARCGGGRVPAAALQLGRLAGYAAAGAVAAGSVGALAALSGVSAALRPVWMLAHGAALVLGLWLLITARQPAWLAGLGSVRAPQPALAGAGGGGGGWQPVQWQPGRAAGAGKAAAVGLAWVAWPCGLLQSALVVAALASSPVAGAGVMASFGLTSAAGLAVGPALLGGLRRLGATPATEDRVLRGATRAAGAMLVAGSAWAAFHDIAVRFVAWCVA